MPFFKRIRDQYTAINPEAALEATAPTLESSQAELEEPLRPRDPSIDDLDLDQLNLPLELLTPVDCEAVIEAIFNPTELNSSTLVLTATSNELAGTAPLTAHHSRSAHSNSCSKVMEEPARSQPQPQSHESGPQNVDITSTASPPASQLQSQTVHVPAHGTHEHTRTAPSSPSSSDTSTQSASTPNDSYVYPITPNTNTNTNTTFSRHSDSPASPPNKTIHMPQTTIHTTYTANLGSLITLASNALRNLTETSGSDSGVIHIPQATASLTFERDGGLSITYGTGSSDAASSGTASSDINNLTTGDPICGSGSSSNAKVLVLIDDATIISSLSLANTNDKPISISTLDDPPTTSAPSSTSDKTTETQLKNLRHWVDFEFNQLELEKAELSFRRSNLFLEKHEISKMTDEMEPLLRQRELLDTEMRLRTRRIDIRRMQLESDAEELNARQRRWTAQREGVVARQGVLARLQRDADGKGGTPAGPEREMC